MENEARSNAGMFDQIAGSYDFLNHLLSLNIDRRWRKKAINTLTDLKPRQILDAATGTADLAIAAMKLNPEQVVGVDVSRKMLEFGRKKVAKKGLAHKITLVEAACESLPFADESFDAATVAFGVRNFNDPLKGLSEIHRVLRTGGKLVVLEFSLPRNRWIHRLYRLYFHHILPIIGKWFSRDLSAYTYLPESVDAFPKGMDFVHLLIKAGFTNSEYKGLTGGICGLYTGMKNQG